MQAFQATLLPSPFVARGAALEEESFGSVDSRSDSSRPGTWTPIPRPRHLPGTLVPTPLTTANWLDPAWVDELLPTRRAQSHLQRDRSPHLGTDYELATEETPHRMARTPPQIPSARHLAARPLRDQVQGCCSVPSFATATAATTSRPREPRQTATTADQRTLTWRAQSGESLRPGSAGGL